MTLCAPLYARLSAARPLVGLLNAAHAERPARQGQPRPSPL